MSREQKPKSRIIVEWQPDESKGNNESDSGSKAIERKLKGNFSITLPAIAQTEHLPDMIERICEQIGQEFKRIIYKQAIEIADYELVMSRRAGKEGKGIQRIGMRPYCFKTIFGTVKVQRIRIKHKADGSTEVPSRRNWKTPRQVCFSGGLKQAVCDTAMKESYRNTLKQIERRSGEEKLLSKSSVINILHREGERLRAAQSRRARRVYESDQQAKRLLVRAEAYLGEEFFEQVWLNKEDLDDEDYDDEQLKELFQEIEWSPLDNMPQQPAPAAAAIDNAANTFTTTTTTITPTTNPDTNNAVAIAGVEVGIDIEAAANATATIESKKPISWPLNPNLIVVQPDEVVVRSQQSDNLWLHYFNAVVITSMKPHYLTAPSSAQLLYQVGSLLSALGITTSDKQLLVISDGAAWIRRWYESIGLAPDKKPSVLCWYHLKKHCWKLVREAIKNKEDRLEIRKELKRYLWRGQVTAARAYLGKILTNIDEGLSKIELSSIKALEALRQYLLMRAPHIPDYLKRLRNKQWIANTKIEKYNDWSISARCKKKNGCKWTVSGVGAIAALEAARRNGELERWRECGRLEQWQRVA